MEKMKINATPVCLKYGVGKQMVDIDQHRSYQNQIGFFPILLEENNGDKEWKT
jgi:hypothetical protein